MSQKLQPFMKKISEAKARQSEPTAERDLLAQHQAAALKAFQVHSPDCDVLVGAVRMLPFRVQCICRGAI